MDKFVIKHKNYGGMELEISVTGNEVELCLSPPNEAPAVQIWLDKDELDSLRIYLMRAASVIRGFPV